jgi:hypothetical protein
VIFVKIKIEDESKEEKFKRLASLRTQKVLDNIRILGNCSNKSLYAYTESEINKIFGTIERELKMTKEKFKIKSGYKFSLG